MKGFPEPTIVDANGVRLAVFERDGDPERRRDPLVLVHGWPEIAYSWKNQIGALAAAGWRVLAPDLKGFGRSEAPPETALYDVAHMTGDLVALLDALDVEKAVFCGHDWGGALVWPMAQLHPDQVAAVIGVCTPHRKPPPAPPLAIIESRFGPGHYIVQFQEDGAPETLFATDPDRFFRLMFRRPAAPARLAELGARIYDIAGRFRNGPPPTGEDALLSDDDIAVYVEAYQRSGFRGGVNLYRNIDRNHAFMKSRDPVIPHEALWIGAQHDPFLPVDGADGMETIVPRLEKHVIEDCGHWVMWERPDALNAILIDWLTRKMPV